ncbi:hypothetical protein E1211_30225, partial [Micromonospora sp. 15K316]
MAEQKDPAEAAEPETAPVDGAGGPTSAEATAGEQPEPGAPAIPVRARASVATAAAPTSGGTPVANPAGTTYRATSSAPAATPPGPAGELPSQRDSSGGGAQAGATVPGATGATAGAAPAARASATVPTAARATTDESAAARASAAVPTPPGRVTASEAQAASGARSGAPAVYRSGPVEPDAPEPAQPPEP